LPRGATVVAIGVALARIYRAVFAVALDGEAIRLGWEAWRTHVLRVPWDAVFGLIGASIVAYAIFVWWLVALTFLPRSAAISGLAARNAYPAVAVVAGGFAISTLLDAPAAGVDETNKAPASDLFDQERMLSELERRRDELLAHVTAKRRPDILFVHVESMRRDMMRSEIMPHLTELAGECLVSPHHYTTGNNTGTSMFGVLTGQAGAYYPLARARHAQPLPLAILRRLGYRTSVSFTNNLRTYDGIYGLLFDGLVDETYGVSTDRVEIDDASMIDHYLAEIAGAKDRPRFDYLVLDSSHYDYAYPPAFEKFRPTMTLGAGMKDTFVTRPGINDEMKGRGPFIRNRYQNSLLYVDSLIDRLMTRLRSRDAGKQPIVVIFGDHGEEFWEHGSFGHGLSLSEEQTSVPLLVCLPERTTTRYHYSTHADVFPTIFELMQLDDTGIAFMSGKSLLSYERSLDVAVTTFGVTGKAFDRRRIVAGDEMKVSFFDSPPFNVTKVSDYRDVELPPSPIAKALVARALASETLR
jgi:membrane-anchored protein YejM (alkaline phosphatase superfamily)